MAELTKKECIEQLLDWFDSKEAIADYFEAEEIKMTVSALRELLEEKQKEQDERDDFVGSVENEVEKWSKKKCIEHLLERGWKKTTLNKMDLHELREAAIESQIYTVNIPR